MTNHLLEREARAYLESVDAFTRKISQARGAEAISEAGWLAATRSVLTAAFERERQGDELLGDFLARISGAAARPKSVPFRATHPKPGIAELWSCVKRSVRAECLAEIGQPRTLASRSWSALPEDVRQKLGAGYNASLEKPPNGTV